MKNYKPQIIYIQEIIVGILMGLMALIIIVFALFQRDRHNQELEIYRLKAELIQQVKDTCEFPIRHFKILPSGAIEVGC